MKPETSRDLPERGSTAEHGTAFPSGGAAGHYEPEAIPVPLPMIETSGGASGTAKAAESPKEKLFTD